MLMESECQVPRAYTEGLSGAKLSDYLFLAPAVAILTLERVMPIDSESEGEVLTRIDEELKEPDEYKVLLINDDFTTMEFVVTVIMTVFHKSLPESTRIMLDVHRRGKGTVGVYSYDIAVTKINQVHQLARQNGFPLKCTMEKS
jgi:ATP-dependent Clp protease adaptor protein ClpS